MTVKQLKEILNKYPDDMNVYVEFYDGWEEYLSKEIVIHKNNTVAFYIQIDDKGFYLSGYNPEFQSKQVLANVVDKLTALTRK